MGRSYNPTRAIKSSGVHTFYIGRPEDPISQAFESYCTYTEQTFSESCRDMVVYFLVKQGLIDDPGVDNGILLNAGEGKLTPKFYEFRKQAEQIRKEQLRRLAKVEKQKKSKSASVVETAFD